MAEDRSAGARGPLFYRRPMPLSPERHRHHRLDTNYGAAFARKASAVPVNVSEFAAACHHYPIVFAGAGNAAPVSVLGLGPDENLFVDAEGRWEARCYVPAYVRRYPFIFHERDGGDHFALCIDEDAGAVSVDGKGEPLFVGEEPSLMTKRALEFCTAFQREAALTRAFTAAVREQGLLSAGTARLRQGEGVPKSLGGFHVIDQSKLNDMADETFLDWRRRGFLPLVYAHLFSMANWDLLSARRRPSVGGAEG